MTLKVRNCAEVCGSMAESQRVSWPWHDGDRMRVKHRWLHKQTIKFTQVK